MKEFIQNRKGFSFVTLNCQSLRAHALDLTDSITRSSNILLLCETKMGNQEQYDIPNFHCIAQFQRTGYTAGGVAIYQNNNCMTKIITRRMSLQFRRSQLNEVNAELCEVGEGFALHIWNSKTDKLWS